MADELESRLTGDRPLTFGESFARAERLGPVPGEIKVVREAQIDRLEPLTEKLAALVSPHLHQRPGARVLCDAPQLLLVTRLERLQPDAGALEDYVKCQTPPSSNSRRMRRATTILCTSSAPS